MKLEEIAKGKRQEAALKAMSEAGEKHRLEVENERKEKAEEKKQRAKQRQALLDELKIQTNLA